MKSIESNEVIQIGIVVKDIESVAQNYADIFGMEKPNIRFVAPDVTYRGVKVSPKAKICSFKMGNMSLELIQPDDEPSSWKEFLETKGEGVHHLGFVIKDKEVNMEFLKNNGIDERQLGVFKGGNYSFVESEDKLGVLLNIKYNDPT